MESRVSITAWLLEGPRRQAFAIKWLGHSPDRKELARRMSPLTYVRPGLPPIITIVGDQDIFYPHELRLREALTWADVPNELIIVPGGKHWDWPTDQYLRAQEAIFAFLERHKVLAHNQTHN